MFTHGSCFAHAFLWHKKCCSSNEFLKPDRMKKTKWLIVLIIAACSASVSISCKNKKTESTTQEDKTKDNSVEISSDATLRSSVNDVVRAYDGVQADVKDGVVTLRGNIKQDELQTLIMKVQELKPKKVENQLVIKS
jgi:ABC-type oligopeptide transport system substrate-binding subunit